MAEGWQFAYHPSPALPALAWIVVAANGSVDVRCGTSVRTELAGFFEGTWVGGSELAEVPRSTAVFGSGIVADGDSLVVVPPSHPCERLYLYSEPNRPNLWFASNSLVGLLDAADLELDPDAPYPSIFVAAAEDAHSSILKVPTSRGAFLSGRYDNFRIGPAGELSVSPRPREQPFASFADFRDRITAALRSAVANAPGYEMAVSLSSGYDSTAVAAIAANVGCRLALSFREAKPLPTGGDAADSGEQAAGQLGMSIETFDRLEYLSRQDLPEAQFLATGMSGEDVVMTAMEARLSHRMLLTGSEAFRLKGLPYRPPLHRGDLSASSLTEFRLRSNFIHLPLLFFGASEKRSLIRITDSPEMAPWTMPGLYDKPIQRRLAEEAGVRRGTFATVKRRASARIHSDGLAAMAPATAAAVTRFALEEGRHVPSGRRPPIRSYQRLLLKWARRLRLDPLVAPLSRRRRALIHFEPELGTLLFRWAVSVVRPRYASVAGARVHSRPTSPANLKSSADA